MFVSGIPEGSITYDIKEEFSNTFRSYCIYFFFFYMTKKMKEIEVMVQGVK